MLNFNVLSNILQVANPSLLSPEQISGLSKIIHQSVELLLVRESPLTLWLSFSLVRH